MEQYVLAEEQGEAEAKPVSVWTPDSFIWLL